ncbi:Hypothetical protein OINT_2000534 [Brucella intermedia LMG 3301]|uniref:Uncharacterized protein n=1 Tax=Brucella intermedia LMG 3301 TaxID=641118 RepID=C4WPF1_9HYPH|nr:Hypothetical protein OINT_2000534 [Brucella intermedia LMG 3301]
MMRRRNLGSCGFISTDTKLAPDQIAALIESGAITG